MKLCEKEAARRLRKQGLSINEIVRKVNASKGSISYWVRDIRLTNKQTNKLSQKGRSRLSIERRRISRIANTQRKHYSRIENASCAIGQLNKRELWLIGIALYWGEGAKKTKNTLSFSNSDPEMIRLWMRFLKEIYGVPAPKIKAHIHAYKHNKPGEVEKYWSKITGLPKSQFYKTYRKNSSASKQKRNTLPHGTVALYVCDTNLQLDMLGWIEGLKQ